MSDPTPRPAKRQQRKLAMDRAKGQIRTAVEVEWPRNWVDPLLTGPASPLNGAQFDCRVIERLLDNLKQRILRVIDQAEMK